MMKLHIDNIWPFDPGILALLALGFWIATGLVHIMLAIGVLRNGSRVVAERGRLELVGIFTWFLATLLGGVWVAAAYWLIHHSTLRQEAGEI